MRLLRVAFLLLAVTTFKLVAAPLDYYFDQHTRFKQNIPTPHEVIGIEVGERHLRHDQLIHYFQALAKASSNVQLTDIGTTYQGRRQIIATVSSADNLANLDRILDNRHTSYQQRNSDPAVIWLGYSIHGNEISGSHASLLLAYQLAASTSPEISQLLKDLIIVIEPSMNPDGMDRFANWVNTNRGATVNGDPNHREHHLQWPNSRLNHYMFDLNRDWLALSQRESQNRLRYYHRYKPNVLADFHEMDHNSSYFFQPGVPSRNNPLTPSENIELTELLATFHARELDANNRLYYSEESFDDFFYGKGSTYPDINGAIGILFEQASSRGFVQDTINGPLTFAYGIKNHLLTSLSTLKGAWQHKKRLHRYRHQFYQQIDDLVDEQDFAGYVFTSADAKRLQMFLQLLEQHQIDAYALSKDYRHKSDIYLADNSYFVPLQQPQYRLVKTLFSRVTEFADSTFYDVSGWTMPLAFNLRYNQVDTDRGLSVSTLRWQWQQNELANHPIHADNSDVALTQSDDSSAAMQPSTAYAYVFDWQRFNAPKLLNQLLQHGIKARVATKPFNAFFDEQTTAFNAGTIIIPSALQTTPQWQLTLQQFAQQSDITLTRLLSGYNDGIDVGSPSVMPIKPVKVMIIGGYGISDNEVGHMLYYLDQQMTIAASVIDVYRLDTINFNDYTHILLVDGDYNVVGEKTASKLRHFVEQGGVVYGQKAGVAYLSANGLLRAKLASATDAQRAFNGQGLDYQQLSEFYAKQRIAGSILHTQLDTTHPLAFGVSNGNLPIFKNSNDIIKLPNEPFITLGRYHAKPLLSGYVAQPLLNQLSDNAAIVAHTLGQGRVIASDSNLVFRGHWPATAKIIANALFFAHAFDTTPPN
ncbi:M14 family zinc carboxypeptidase [Thalassotalea ponticola]|uniref:M14 family zinc carboxypeptidase n=1 Tax=Thalassotalea ponticola TaxID=1523392 RepID=UPI0025B44ED9|nr:M14 family zinc carboxypeptidase [Thalassotalea ponticola]MDN3652296.1 M14 family zinc carboxypeptidase [Thalassotalea ponticola]